MSTPAPHPHLDVCHCAPNDRPGVEQGGFRAGIDVRISLRPEAGWGDATFDGAWWPRTCDLAAEAPELLTELVRRGVRVERFAYPLDVWPPLPRRMAVPGAVVRAGGYRGMDAHVVSLTWASGTRRADLLVIPPETDAITGTRALRLCCTRRRPPRSPQQVMAAARATPVPQVTVPRPRRHALYG
jgi:hypothetical protein